MNEFGPLIEPQPIGFSFAAPGWYVLGGLLLMVLFWTAVFIWKYHRRNKYRKHALEWLQHIRKNSSEENNYSRLVFESAMLLKRIAITKYGRTNVAGKTHMDFMLFLNSKWKREAFDYTDAKMISDSIYSTRSIHEDEAAHLIEKVQRWIREHHVKK